MIYLDNAATTKPSQKAVEAMIKAADIFGNPSSLHGIGLQAEKMINTAKDSLAKILVTNSKNIYFTSGGTEANNLAIIGTARAMKRRGTRVITSTIEHPSVLEAFKILEKEGFDVKYVNVTRSGIIDTDELKTLLNEETVLVSIMHTNNETGVIQPISEVVQAVREQTKNCIIHCDCVQAFGKIKINFDKMGVDMISISAHKVHGFKGCGALCTKTTHITPIIHGGEQQNEVRPGTENVGGILSFAAAACECTFNQAEMQRKRDLMIELLQSKLDNVSVNGDADNSGSVLNVSFVGIKAEILLHSLERHEIYVSTGSACSSHKPQPSHVLQAMGVNPKAIDGAVRISFSQYTTDEDITFAAEKISDEVKNIRKYM